LPNVGNAGFTDLNNLTANSGLYYFGANINNAPESFIAVLSIRMGEDVLQIAFSMRNAKMYRRRHSSSGWTNWTVINFT